MHAHQVDKDGPVTVVVTRIAKRDKIREFEELFLTSLSARHQNVLDNLRDGKLIDDDVKVLKDLANELKGQFKV